MKKIAIVGVEGSGKTVMMAAMGEQWERPDERGYFLSPENAEAFGFSKSVMAILRSGRWPNASSHDEMRTLEWSLQRRQGGNLEKIADISMLDYAGEVYRQAFGGEKREGYDEQVATLRSHVDEADVLIVLVNLSDIISGSMSDRRTRDAMWLTKSVLDYALGGKPRKPHAAIVFTQSDSYREIISANGGTAATLKKYLPHVASLYDDLPIFTASAIDRTVIGSDGLPIPAPGFSSVGLKELMDWMTNVVKDECKTEYISPSPRAEMGQVSKGKAAKKLVQYGCLSIFALLLVAYAVVNKIDKPKISCMTYGDKIEESLPSNPYHGQTVTISIPGGGGIQMIYCAAGHDAIFDKEAFSSPPPTVERGFWLSKYEITQAQWWCVMGNKPSAYKGGFLKRNWQLPVECVSWDDCQEFIKRINSGGHIKARLPTVIEWRYACMAGDGRPWYECEFDEELPEKYKGSGMGELNRFGWYDCNSEEKTHRIGGKRANAWGFYDMHGNVEEWCSSWDGSEHEVKGGSIRSTTEECSVFFGRTCELNAASYIGFRLCCSAGK